MSEACIEYDMNWLKGRDYIEVTFPGKTKEKGLLKKMAAEGVPGVLITAENKDGSIVGHVPLECVLFRRPPKEVELTEERLAILARATAASKEKRAKTNENGEEV